METPQPSEEQPAAEEVQYYRPSRMEPAEEEALKAEIQAVLKKYDAELVVASNIQVLKRVKVDPKEVAKEPTVPEGSVPSPFPLNDGPDQDGSAPVQA